MPAPTQGDLFSPVRNRGVFSSHWLEHRLALEPEWRERADEAAEALARLGKLWKPSDRRSQAARRTGLGQ